MPGKRTTIRILGWFLLLAIAQTGALAQASPPLIGEPILKQFQAATDAWISPLLGFARGLFFLLAGIEFAWTGITLLLDRHDLEGWVAAFLRKLMWLSFFFILLDNAADWIPKIISSFETIGVKTGIPGASLGGPNNVQPGAILGNGFNIAGSMVTAIGSQNLFSITGIAITLTMIFAIIMVLLCYVFIVIQFIMAKVESFIVLSAGFIYLGFGGSRWTSSYVERFLSSAVGVGIRLMVIYLMIGIGDRLAIDWINQANSIAGSSNLMTVVTTGFSIIAGVLIFATLCWSLPKVVASVMTGSPNLSGGDLLGTATAVAGAGALAVAGVASGGAALAGGGAALAGGAAAAGGGGAAAAAGGGGMSASAAAGMTGAGGAAGLGPSAMAGSEMAGGMGGSSAAGMSSGSMAAEAVPPPAPAASSVSASAPASASASASVPPPPLASALQTGSNLLRGVQKVGDGLSKAAYGTHQAIRSLQMPDDGGGRHAAPPPLKMES